MSTTLQSDVAITIANQVITLVSQIKLVRSQVAEITKVNTDNPLGTLWNALKTCVLNGDGTLGAADGTPTAGHSIDSRVYPNLQREVTNTNLTDALQILVDFIAFCNGTQVNANAARPAQINNVSM